MGAIKNIAYKFENKVKITEKRQFIQDLNLLSFPDLLSLPVNRYVTPFAIITSRGCPGDCVYCSSRAMSGKNYRMRSAESIFSEIFYLSEKIMKNHYNLKSYIAIYDDTFTVNTNRLKKFCNYMIDSGLNKFLWKCESRIDVLTEELIVLMRTAGCFAIHVGVESADQSVVNSLNKHINLDKIETALKVMNQNGIQPLCSFIIGNHEDTHITLENTKRFIEHIIRTYRAKVAISPNTPLPGTPLYNFPDQYGIKIKSKNWDDYSLTNAIIDTKNLTSNEIRKYYVEITEFSEVMEGKSSD